MPPEVVVDPALVRRLLADQHPDLAEHEPIPAGAGWDNAIFRLGPDLAARLPTRRLGADLVAGEVRWLPHLAEVLPLPIPAPARIGRPGHGYPWSWTIVPWFDGELACDAPLDPGPLVHDLVAFLAALARPAPPDAPHNPWRGVPLAERDEPTRQRVAALGSEIDAAAVLEIWAEALAARVHVGAPVWVHGDLHPANLIVRDARLHAVIDFGDLTAGDPAGDLSVAWMLLEATERAQLRAALAVDDATWIRARGNALAHAVACLNAPADDLRIRRIGATTLARVLDR